MSRSKVSWRNTQFIRSCLWQKDYPKCTTGAGLLPEIAVVGRSNVGKSTLLNDLFGTRLAKTSNTPGKTQLLNFFMVDEQFLLVDLPGYGYAKAPLQMKQNWSSALQNYCAQRDNLVLILWLLDIRRIPNSDDVLFFDWASHAQKKILVIATKADKMGPQEVQKNARFIREYFGFDEHYPLVYSAKTHQGKQQLQGAIQEFLHNSGK
jgi:GTP-binding protein